MPKATCLRRPATGCSCRFAELAPRHHDLLVNVEFDMGSTLELIEMATTWEELDYSGEAVVPPAEWMEFAAVHNWRDPDLVARLFSVATDVASRSAVPALTAWAAG